MEEYGLKLMPGGIFYLSSEQGRKLGLENSINSDIISYDDKNYMCSEARYYV